jgi:hypothetical protein
VLDACVVQEEEGGTGGQVNRRRKLLRSLHCGRISSGDVVARYEFAHNLDQSGRRLKSRARVEGVE